MNFAQIKSLWRRSPWWKKALLFVPLLLIAIAIVVIKRPTRLSADEGAEAVRDTAAAGEAAINVIREEGNAIVDRASERADAVVSAAGESCGQFNSAADLYSKPRG